MNNPTKMTRYIVSRYTPDDEESLDSAIDDHAIAQANLFSDELREAGLDFEVIEARERAEDCLWVDITVDIRATPHELQRAYDKYGIGGHFTKNCRLSYTIPTWGVRQGAKNAAMHVTLTPLADPPTRPDARCFLITIGVTSPGDSKMSTITDGPVEIGNYGSALDEEAPTRIIQELWRKLRVGMPFKLIDVPAKQRCCPLLSLIMLRPSDEEISEADRLVRRAASDYGSAAVSLAWAERLVRYRPGLGFDRFLVTPDDEPMVELKLVEPNSPENNNMITFAWTGGDPPPLPDADGQWDACRRAILADTLRVYEDYWGSPPDDDTLTTLKRRALYDSWETIRRWAEIRGGGDS